MRTPEVLALGIWAAELDSVTGPQVVRDLRPTIEREGSYDVVIDIHQVELIDSAGVAALITLHNFVVGRRGSFALRRVQPRVHRVLQRMALAELLIPQ